MERNKEWDNLLQETNEFPVELNKTIEKLNKRRMKRRIKSLSLTGLTTAAAFIFFVLLVNTNTVFANGIMNVPVLKDLAAFVTFDKSLNSAIENEYVQEMNLTATNGSTTLGLPYVIADEKNLVAFFQVPKDLIQNENDWIQLFSIEMKDLSTGEKIEGYADATQSVSKESLEQNNGLNYIHYKFAEGTLPKSVEITVKLEIGHVQSGVVNKDDFITTPTGEIQYGSSITNYEDLGTFTYSLTFDDFAKPKVYDINQEKIVNGQKLTIEKITVLPTGTEVFITFDKDNTARINGLELETINRNNEVLKSAGGISGFNDPDGYWTKIYIESNYFNNSKDETLLIKGIRLMNKDEEYITVNLDDKTFEPQIDGMKLTEVIKKDTNAYLTFETKAIDNFSVFYFEYKDSTGKIYQMNSEGGRNINDILTTSIKVAYPDDRIIILKRSMSPMIELPTPIEIPLHQ